MIKYKEGENLYITFNKGLVEDCLHIFPDKGYLFNKGVGEGYGRLANNIKNQTGQKSRHISVSRDVMGEITTAYKNGKCLLTYMAKSRAVRRLK